jgi:hypothetical protein
MGRIIIVRATGGRTAHSQPARRRVQTMERGPVVLRCEQHRLPIYQLDMLWNSVHDPSDQILVHAEECFP